MPMLIRHSFRVLAAAAVLGAVAMFLPDTVQAQQIEAETTTGLNQRAGPGTRFPVMTTVPRGGRITLHGCLADYDWCDGTYRGIRGWFAAAFLEIAYRGSWMEASDYARYAYLPVVSFQISSYWDRFYRDEPFYARISAYTDGVARIGDRASVSVSVGSFYRPLAPYGRWTEVRGRYVWVPDVSSGWHPYTEGRWVHTRRYGWTWISYEPHGWATHHYGRWAYSSTIGWFWIPGTRWAPAWVAWRSSGDYLSWAPLPPVRDDVFGFSISLSFSDIPHYYWRAVPIRQFQSADISNVVIGDNNTIINIINQSQPAGTVVVENEIVVNNAIDVDFIEKETGEPVVTRELELTASEQVAGEVIEDRVEIFHPSELAESERPEEVVSTDEVAETSTTTGQAGDEPGTEDRVPPAPQAGVAPPEDRSGPPARAERAERQPGPPADAGPTVDVPEGEACPEGTARLPGGSCGEPAAAPAEEVAPEAPAESREAPGQREQPAEEAEPQREEGAPAAAEPCPEGTLRQADGSCAPATEARPAPAEEVTPEAPAEERGQRQRQEDVAPEPVQQEEAAPEPPRQERRPQAEEKTPEAPAEERGQRQQQEEATPEPPRQERSRRAEPEATPQQEEPRRQERRRQVEPEAAPQQVKPEAVPQQVEPERQRPQREGGNRENRGNPAGGCAEGQVMSAEGQCVSP
ncbi:hypothetical protein HPQ64_16045 [Rhizobiales bacterium]|uniref:DUF6600 domain-containing protein n=1 Tax=Hongsoonwoonella zoysiae TaxID=2821844 RepID=UPI00155F9BFA|nr:DUF6600 domain-containing protein [Hongsoonwoonella zoysiae]NRG19203.1 hypothetical protein [Hongsoonwoonella zoysiae]